MATVADAAAVGELVVNATNGAGSIAALEAAGAEHLAGKALIDIANPLDFSAGIPPSLLVSNTDSLAEQIQRRLPDTRVVKALNTVNASMMVDPKQLADGDHTMFVSGNDSAAKSQVTELLRSMGWSDVIDLGDITTARSTEMYLPLWARVWGVTQNPISHQSGSVARDRRRPPPGTGPCGGRASSRSRRCETLVGCSRPGRRRPASNGAD